MKSCIHLFDGYVSVEGRVRAQCSCGFLTVAQSAQRGARQQLALSHGLTDLACEVCGRQTGRRFDIGLPAELVVQDHPVRGFERLVCAQGSGGCDLTSQLGTETAAQITDALQAPVRDIPAEVAHHQATTVALAVGVLMGTVGVNRAVARARLARNASSSGLTEYEAASRIIAAAAIDARQLDPEEDSGPAPTEV